MVNPKLGGFMTDARDNEQIGTDYLSFT